MCLRSIREYYQRVHDDIITVTYTAMMYTMKTIQNLHTEYTRNGGGSSYYP